MNIKRLTSENVKRIQVVDISPDGNTVIIGGDNAQGKSSVLDSIFMALGGKSAQGKRPVRDGKDKAVIKCDLGDLVVTRTIKPNGNTTVRVKSLDGAMYPSPQSMLDALSSKLTFDPLAFAQNKPKDQLDTLKGLVGLDFTEEDAKRGIVFEKRKSINREGKERKARLDGMTFNESAPDTPVSVSALMEELSTAEATNLDNAAKRDDVATRSMEIAEMKAEIEAKTLELKGLESGHDESVKKSEKLVDIGTETIREKISKADTINAAVRGNESYCAEKVAVERLRKESQSLTDKLNAIDKAKADAMGAAEFPIYGLSFDENGVIFNGVPFDQCSSAERLIVSLNMGIAMNPELKVLLIRDGSLLDENSLAIVAKAAEDSGSQVWIERVSKGDECSVIIEDGKVVG